MEAQDENHNLTKLKSKVKSILDDKKENKPIKNTIAQDFSKGSLRNQKCPECGKKLKKCSCFAIEKDPKHLVDELL